MPRILSHSVGLGCLCCCCLPLSPGGALCLSATLQIIRFSYPMNFTTIFKTFTQQQQKTSLTPSRSFAPTRSLLISLTHFLFAFSASACQFVCFSYGPSACVYVRVCVCVCVGVRVCVIYEFYMCCICRRRAAALFMRVSPFYVYLNFLVGAQNERVRAEREKEV